MYLYSRTLMNNYGCSLIIPKVLAQKSPGDLGFYSFAALTLTLITRNLTYFPVYPYHVMLRNRNSFLPITLRGIIFTLRHVGLFGNSVQKYIA